MTKREPTVAEQFKTMLDEMKQHDSYHVGAMKFEISEQVFVAMEESGITEAELSRRLGVSRAYVNKILQGDANLTIESLVKIGRALGCPLVIEFKRSPIKKAAKRNGRPSAKAPDAVRI